MEGIWEMFCKRKALTILIGKNVIQTLKMKNSFVQDGEWVFN